MDETVLTATAATDTKPALFRNSRRDTALGWVCISFIVLSFESAVRGHGVVSQNRLG